MKHGHHWSDFATGGNRSKNRDREDLDLSLAEVCQQYETVELWFDVQPNAQLKLVWLLDYFRSYPETIAKLKFCLVDLAMIELRQLGRWRPPVVDVTEKELETASAAWQAYRSPTPEACFDLLGKDLSALPLLKPVLIDLLEELPSGSTGLGASEMRMLELIARGYSLTNALFHFYQLRQRASSASGNTATCWMGWRSGRNRPWRASTRSCVRSTATICATGTRPTCAAGCRSPNSAGPFSPTRKTSAGTIQLTAGGAART